MSRFKIGEVNIDCSVIEIDLKARISAYRHFACVQACIKGAHFPRPNG